MCRFFHIFKWNHHYIYKKKKSKQKPYNIQMATRSMFHGAIALQCKGIRGKNFPYFRGISSITFREVIFTLER